jgi:hypothetical protein
MAELQHQMEMLVAIWLVRETPLKLVEVPID